MEATLFFSWNELSCYNICNFLLPDLINLSDDLFYGHRKQDKT